MTKKNEEKSDKKEALHLQYHECYESMRHHNTTLWQIPFLLIIITGAVVISAFRYLEAGLIRASLILVSALISYALFIAIVKHHYYYEIELETLNRIEDELGTKRIKRNTFASKYLFSWDNVPRNESGLLALLQQKLRRDNKRLLNYLGDDLEIGWAKKAKISKSDDGKTICISNNKKSAEIMIDEEKEKAILKIRDGGTHDLKVKKENRKLKIYTNDNNKYWVVESPREPYSPFTKFFRLFEIQSSHIALMIGVFLIFLIQIYLVKLAFL